MRKKKDNSDCKGECNVRNFRHFFFSMSSDVPAFKVCVFAHDFEFLVELNEY